MRAISMRLVRAKTGKPPRQPSKHRPFRELTLRWQLIVNGSTWVLWISCLDLINHAIGAGPVNPFDFGALFPLPSLVADLVLIVAAFAVLAPAYRGCLYLVHRLYDALGWTRYVPRPSEDDHAVA